MSDNEKLIARAKLGIDNLRTAIHPANSRGDDAEFIKGHVNWVMPALRELLEAAEKAHTPTDDEREALLVKIATEASERVGGYAHPGYAAYDAAHRAASAALRRSEVPEPSGWDGSVPNDNYGPWGGTEEKPQDEPSDAQALADEIENYMRRQDWMPATLAIRAVAALRAASAATGDLS